MEFYADGWIILKYTEFNKSIYFRIFASWIDDVWRLSSGSRELPQLSTCGDFWIWPQTSGSCYYLPIAAEDGYTFYTGFVLSSIIKQSGVNDIQIDRAKLTSLQAL